MFSSVRAKRSPDNTKKARNSDIKASMYISWTAGYSQLSMTIVNLGKRTKQDIDAYSELGRL